MGSFPLLAASDNPKADEIFEKIINGHGTSDSHSQMLSELETLISRSDTPRRMRLNALKCWEPDISNNQVINAAIAYAEQWLQHDSMAPYPKLKLELLLCKSWYLEQKNEVEIAMQGYNQAVKQAYALEDNRLIADARSIRGELFSFQGNFSAALEDLITAQHLYENQKLSYWSNYNLGSIATSYRRFGDPQNAIRYFEQQKQAHLKRGEIDIAAGIETEIGFSYEELGEYEKALEKHLKVYRAGEQKKLAEFDMAIFALNVAAALLQLERTQEALQYLQQAKPHIASDQIGFYGELNIYLAQAYLNTSKLELAFKHVVLAEEAHRKSKNQRGEERALFIKSQILGENQDWQAAYDTQRQLFETHKALDAKQESRRTAEIRGRFNSDKMEQENLQLLEYKRLKEQEHIITQQNKYLQVAVLLLALVIIIILGLYLLKQFRRTRTLEALALTDHLTQLPNRRHIYVRGEKEFAKSKANHTDFSIILFDADHFKKVNDILGHDAGDNVLVKLAQLSASMMRKGDMVGRIGGEEFLILLRETPLNQAQIIAERLVTTIANENLDDIDPGFRVTISAGVAAIDGQTNFKELMSRADQALYEAKEAGRNCVKRG